VGVRAAKTHPGSHIVLPEEFADSNLTRQRQNLPEEIAFTAGVPAGGMSAAKPVIRAIQRKNGATDGEIIYVQFGGYAEDWKPLLLDVSAWKVFGKRFLPVCKGVLVGQVDRKSTEGFPMVPGSDGGVALRSTLLLDVETMVRRAGIKISGANALPFLTGATTEQHSDDWNPANICGVVNLNNIDGDVAALLEGDW